MSGSRQSKRALLGGAPGSKAGVAPPPLAADPPSLPHPSLSPGLYLVATPIGNAADISLRALDVLGRAEALACEDTRRTRALMEMHGLSLGRRPMIAYHDRNGAARRPQIMAWLAAGRSVAYASDAGTPLIADPGYRLVEAARAAGHAVHAVPGASALLAALSVSGLPTDRFLFLGFLPVKGPARRSALAEVAALRATLVAFESPRRLRATLADMAAVLGAERPAAVARELTKRFEEVRRGTLGELAAAFAAAETPKGEIVVIIGPPLAAGPRIGAEALDGALADAMAGLTLKEAVGQVAERLGLPRRLVYARALELTGR
jgi:16S rRNA (cytidine1402-2'-O)-methyltransferase